MINTSAYKISNAAIVGIVFISIILIYFFRWSGEGLSNFKHIIDGDGRDYYSYLISIFIDKNLGHQDTTRYYVIQTATGTINQHTVGVAVLLLPFFGIAYLWSLLSGAAPDGFSEPFQKMVSVAALCYFTIGIFFLRRLLIALSFPDKIIAAALLLIFFGTNLLNYALYQPSMSHVYSFTLITVFLYYSNKCIDQLLLKDIVMAAFILGLIVLVRPINGIIVFAIPFFAISFQHFFQIVKKFLFNKRDGVIALLVFLITVSIQSIVWYFQNGQLLQMSYKNAGFYFFNPQILLMLFGFNSGFFIYTPLCLVVLFGLIPIFSKSRFKFAVLFLFILFVFYLFASYWGYTYWDGIGIRPMVEYYSLFTIMLSSLLTSISKSKINFLVYFLILCSAFLNLVYCYQYQAGILPPAGINYNKYRYIFLKTDKQYAGVLGGCNDMQPYSKQKPESSFNFKNTNQITFNGNEFGLDYSIDSLPFYTNQLYFKINLSRKEIAVNSSSDAMIVVTAQSVTGEIKNYQGYKINDTPSTNCCEWQQFTYAIEMGAKLVPGDKLKIYVWNRNRQQFLIRDFAITIYNYNFKT